MCPLDWQKDQKLLPARPTGTRFASIRTICSAFSLSSALCSIGGFWLQENVSDTNDDTPLPRLKPQSLRTKFELEAEPAEASMMGNQKETSAGVRASIGE